MARPKVNDLPPENQRVARAWYAAKADNPKLTQADFAAAAFGGRRRAPGKKKAGAPETWGERQRKADARYLRLVLEGKRRPRKLVAHADRGGIVNVAVRHGGTYSSFNLRLPKGASKLDAFAMAQTPELRETIRRQIEAWAKRYEASLAEFADDEPELRGVRHARSRPIPFAAAS